MSFRLPPAVFAFALLTLLLIAHLSHGATPQGLDIGLRQQNAAKALLEHRDIRATGSNIKLDLGSPGRGDYVLDVLAHGAAAAESGSSELKLYRKHEIATLPARFNFTLEADRTYELVLGANDTIFDSLRLVGKKKVIASTLSNHRSCKAPEASPITVKLSSMFTDGSKLRDAYSGKTYTVRQGHVTVTPMANSEGLVLLEPLEERQNEKEFIWQNATVYFVITDRFANGRKSNDNSYGRSRDGTEDIGTFHGGDIAGLHQRLDYIENLGASAIWITAPYEQMHGWVGGGDRGDFKHYAYHGYYAGDFTRMDANMGTIEELQAFVRDAQSRGIRVIMDVVMNHPGYSTLADMQSFRFGSLHEGMEQYLPERWTDWMPAEYEDYHAYHGLIDYNGSGWANWWGKDWVRAGIGDYQRPPNAGVDPVKGSLAFLPDFRTESNDSVALPYFLRTKKDTGAVFQAGWTVRDYLTHWLSDWVRKVGFDGFRVDTVKHVEAEAWAVLKAKSQKALEDWRRNNPVAATQAAERFWMLGEVFPHGIEQSALNESFDALINFDFQQSSAAAGAECLSNLEPVFADYSAALDHENGLPRHNFMSYISSHDTTLFSHKSKTLDKQKRVAAALLLLPGAVQIFYGDESARKFGPSGSDPFQGTRSDMNWSDLDTPEHQALLRHWQRLAQFRSRHPAIGAGKHEKLADGPDYYAFSRVLEAGGIHDKVIVVSSEARD